MLQLGTVGKSQSRSRSKSGLADAPHAHTGEHLPHLHCFVSGASMDVLGFQFFAGFFFKSGWWWHSDHLVMN
jgi:hypothetical protein